MKPCRVAEELAWSAIKGAVESRLDLSPEIKERSHSLCSGDDPESGPIEAVLKPESGYLNGVNLALQNKDCLHDLSAREGLHSNF